LTHETKTEQINDQPDLHQISGLELPRVSSTEADKGSAMKILGNRKLRVSIVLCLSTIGMVGLPSATSWAAGEDLGSCGANVAKALAPTSIVGKGFYGEKPAMVSALKLSAADKAKIKAGKFTAGIVMQTMNLDWSTLQVQGMKDTFKSLGIKVIGVTDPNFDAQKQISDIENMITKKPDLIISIPTDQVATAQAYKKIAAAKIKLVLIMNVPKGLKYGKDYSAVVSPDDQGNGLIAAASISTCIPQGGTVGIVDFGVDFFTTNQRTAQVKEWFSKNRKDVKVKEVLFTDTNNVGSVTANFITANPDVKGLYIVWDSPAMQSIASLRSAGVTLPISTIDLGNEVALEMANGGYIKAIGAQKPYDQGVAEALAGANALIGKKIPAWISLPAVAVTPGNLLSMYAEVFKKPAPATLIEACAKSKVC
jgi:ribose transport system substrate-binding protein